MITTKILFAACFGSAVVGGLVGALGIATVGKPELTQEPPIQTKRAPSPDALEDVVELEGRLTDLEDLVAIIQSQTRSRQALEKVAQALADGDDPVEAKPKSAMAGVVDAEDPVFELAVRSVMDRIEWEKDEERKVNRARRQSERTEQQTALLQQRLQLTDVQSQAVTGALGKQREQLRALRGNDSEERPRLTRTEWRERAAEIRQQTEAELGKVLNEEQLQGYRTFLEEEGIGPRGSRERPQEGSQERRGSREGRQEGPRERTRAPAPE